MVVAEHTWGMGPLSHSLGPGHTPRIGKRAYWVGFSMGLLGSGVLATPEGVISSSREEGAKLG